MAPLKVTWLGEAASSSDSSRVSPTHWFPSQTAKSSELEEATDFSGAALGNLFLGSPSRVTRHAYHVPGPCKTLVLSPGWSLSLGKTDVNIDSFLGQRVKECDKSTDRVRCHAVGTLVSWLRACPVQLCGATQVSLSAAT